MHDKEKKDAALLKEIEDIANMEYYSEYQMKDAGERIIDYHILDIDIPS